MSKFDENWKLVAEMAMKTLFKQARSNNQKKLDYEREHPTPPVTQEKIEPIITNRWVI